MRTDLPPITEIWVYLSGSPLLARVLTLGAYLVGLTLYEKSERNPLANPVLIAVILVSGAIQWLDMPYADGRQAMRKWCIRRKLPPDVQVSV